MQTESGMRAPDFYTMRTAFWRVGVVSMLLIVKQQCGRTRCQCQGLLFWQVTISQTGGYAMEVSKRINVDAHIASVKGLLFWQVTIYQMGGYAMEVSKDGGGQGRPS